jgi:Beta-ketoacyl synthase, N-terminal domain
MRALTVRSVGVCAAGLPDWPRASRVLAGEAAFEPGLTTARSLDGLPATERRRINETSRLACLAAADALATLPLGAAADMPAIFASSDGDGVVLAQLLTALARSNIVVSPTSFHNSVYNAPAGYWTIAARSTAPSTTVCADRESFSVALLEAYAQATVSNGSVLVVAVDAPFPEAIRSLGTSAAPFACAIVLDGSPEAQRGPQIKRWTTGDRAVPAQDDDLIAAAYAGNAAAAALPLLRALARRDAVRVELPYLDGTALELEVAP